MIKAPDAGEYPSFYETYVSLVPGEGGVVVALEQQLAEMLALLGGLSAAQADSRYAPGKWSVKELVGHVIDSERVFAYRALSFARGDTTPLPGFDQDVFADRANFGACSVPDLAAEFEHVRRANLHLFRQFDEEAWGRRGVANNSEITVRALAYGIAGHELHHRKILRTRYL
ncbi:MAG: DinB family protein [Pyrinomonadaceae bacterium]|nr:DinB family protein [Pyrinomonadaceae bacterium]